MTESKLTLLQSKLGVRLDSASVQNLTYTFFPFFLSFFLFFFFFFFFFHASEERQILLLIYCFITVSLYIKIY